MPALLNWLLRLLPTNPICLRLVQGGSLRLRHLYLRSGYLAILIVVLLFAMLGNIQGQPSVRELAQAGANTFTGISYLQVFLICLLTPVFMAGAIAQEANPQTWDILLTSPLNNLQIVLGNLFGRLFFILALLFSTLPLFAVTQYFGGVPGESIFISYAIAGTSSLLVAAIAITLSVTRTAGRRAVFVFYIAVVVYLFATYFIDRGLRVPLAAAGQASLTTIMTPLNPFLALEVLLDSNTYVPHSFVDEPANWLTRLWLGRPIFTFCWLCVLISTGLIAFSTLRLRIIGAKLGTVPWWRKLLRIRTKGIGERPGRTVGHNPIAWRESAARGNSIWGILGRWGFVVLGTAVAMLLIGLFHAGTLSANDLRLAIGATLGAEIVIIVLTALNMSATAVSREREDGQLDIILTTPIQPGAYIAGKLKGLVRFLVPMMLVPAITALILSLYVLTDGLGAGNTTIATSIGGDVVNVPLFLPVGALAIPILLVPFIGFCVMIGLHWSVRSKGTIGSVIAAVGIMVGLVGVLSLCAFAAGNSIQVLGAVMSSISPVSLLFALVRPEAVIEETIRGAAGIASAQVSILVGAVIAATIYALLVFGIHSSMKKTFMMTVRKLAGVG